MNRAALMVLALLFAPAVRAQAWEPPTAGEATLMWSAEVQIALDAATTIAALERPGTHEANPLLGSRPSPARVIAFSAAAGVGLGAVWYALPRRCRWVVPVFVGIGEGLVIAGNAAVMLGGRY